MNGEDRRSAESETPLTVLTVSWCMWAVWRWYLWRVVIDSTVVTTYN